MKIKMLRTCFVDGELVEKGKTCEPSKESDAQYLINKKKAVSAETEKAEAKK